ncbi:MAG: hypothetical protein M1826_003374 [Phylliscum demangeonii]|nr:MAG: hypothetical protein M1826_003374 [Phylliscum demangeonii]
MEVDIVNGHIESHYDVGTGKWSEPAFVVDPHLRIHGLASGLNYGQQAFEGVKGRRIRSAFRTPSGQIQIFRPEFHATRLNHSASVVSIPAIPPSHFIECLRLAVVKNAAFVPPHEVEALLYIRPVVLGSGPQLMLSPSPAFTFCVFVTPASAYHGVKPLDALVLDEFDRAAPRGTGTAKVGGNYAPVMRWSDQARRDGFGVTLHLDSQTRTEIDEFSTSAFIGVKEGKGDDKRCTLVVPDSACVIRSVTSESCMDVAESLGWAVEKRSIKYEEVSSFSEVMAVGTAAAILPIRSITRKSTGDKFLYQDGGDRPGPRSVRLAARLQDIQKGRVPDPFGWCMTVEAAEGEAEAVV